MEDYAESRVPLSAAGASIPESYSTFASDIDQLNDAIKEAKEFLVSGAIGSRAISSTDTP